MPQPANPKPPKPTAPPLPAAHLTQAGLPAYAELHCGSNFSFLCAASHPGELVTRAAQLGYAAIAITDDCSVAGVVRAHEAAKEQAEAGTPVQLLIGSTFTLDTAGGVPGCRLVLIAMNREGYAQLCGLITLGRGRSAKGSYRLAVDDLQGQLAGAQFPSGMRDCLALLIPRRHDDDATLRAQAQWLAATFGERASIAVELLLWADDDAHAERLMAVSAASGVFAIWSSSTKSAHVA